MALTYGTHDVASLLATQFSDSVLSLGMDRIWQSIEIMLRIHNEQFQELMGTLVSPPTTDRERVYGGGSSNMNLAELDEYGTPDVQKAAPGVTMGFPLKLYGRGRQWTRIFLKNATPQDFLGTAAGLMDADIRKARKVILDTLFYPSNTTWYDHLVNNAEISMKALVNADSGTIPPLPNGTAVDSTIHTHYMANATLTAAFLQSVIDTVAEHYNTGRTIVWIPKASEATVRLMTGANEFVAYPQPGTIPGSGVTIAQGVLVTNQTYNRAIGVFGTAGTEIWVKPQVPTNYLIAYQEGVNPPLVLRIRDAESYRFGIRYTGEAHPLLCEIYEREYGIGVWERTAAAVARTNNGTYAVPVVTE